MHSWSGWRLPKWECGRRQVDSGNVKLTCAAADGGGRSGAGCRKKGNAAVVRLCNGAPQLAAKDAAPSAATAPALRQAPCHPLQPLVHHAESALRHAAKISAAHAHAAHALLPMRAQSMPPTARRPPMRRCRRRDRRALGEEHGRHRCGRRCEALQAVGLQAAVEGVVEAAVGRLQVLVPVQRGHG